MDIESLIARGLQILLALGGAYLIATFNLSFALTDGLKGIEVARPIVGHKEHAEELAYLPLNTEMAIFRFVELDERHMPATRALEVISRIQSIGPLSEE